MALPIFLDRAIQSLGQVLRGVDRAALAKHLKDFSVALVFDDAALLQANNVTILETLVNIFARLYPTIGVIHKGHKTSGARTRKSLVDLAKAINPSIAISASNRRFTAAVCVGQVEPEFSCDRYWVGAESWNLTVTRRGPLTLPVVQHNNPFSASAAACFVAAEVFRSVFSSVSSPMFGDETLSLSLLNYSRHHTPSMPLPAVQIKDGVLVGVGAIGNAVLWCLKRLPALQGSLTLVDPEVLDLSNLQRYALATQADIGHHKVELASRFSERPGLEIKPHKQSFGDFVAEHRPACDFDTIVVAVDNSFDRMAVQAVLPRLILNGWTGDDGRLGVSRHSFDSSQACLACMYMATSPKKSRTEEIADIIGMDPLEAADWVVKRVRLTRSMLESIAKAGRYTLDVLLPWEGHTLDDFYVEAVCGGALIEAGAAVQEGEALVPLAHQSILAGTLLGCEMIKAELGLIPDDFPVDTRLSLVEKLPDYISTRHGKTPKPRCICSDEDYLSVYRSKHCC